MTSVASCAAQPAATSLIPTIPDLHDATLGARLQHRIDHKTKPLGALGGMEQLALRIGAILGSEAPQLDSPQMLVCAGDYGLAARRSACWRASMDWR